MEFSHHDARLHASGPGRRRLPSVPGDDVLAERVCLFALPEHERLVRREPMTAAVRYVPLLGLS